MVFIESMSNGRKQEVKSSEPNDAAGKRTMLAGITSPAFTSIGWSNVTASGSIQ